MLFALEEQLRALKRTRFRCPSSCMAEICSATFRLTEVVEEMKAVAKDAGAGGRNGGAAAAAAAQEAVARWLAGFDNGVLLVWIHVGTLTSLCQRGKLTLARLHAAESG